MNSDELAYELTPVNSGELAPAPTDDWYAWALTNYLPTHPELLHTDANGRGNGAKALGEAMAEACGKSYESMKGMASEVAKRVRRALQRCPVHRKEGAQSISSPKTFQIRTTASRNGMVG